MPRTSSFSEADHLLIIQKKLDGMSASAIANLLNQMCDRGERPEKNRVCARTVQKQLNRPVLQQKLNQAIAHVSGTVDSEVQRYVEKRTETISNLQTNIAELVPEALKVVKTILTQEEARQGDSIRLQAAKSVLEIYRSLAPTVTREEVSQVGLSTISRQLIADTLGIKMSHSADQE